LKISLAQDVKEKLPENFSEKIEYSRIASKGIIIFVLN